MNACRLFRVMSRAALCLAALAWHSAVAATTVEVQLSKPNSKTKTDVDLELVLAVDISLSMQGDEQRLQRDGYVAAFRDPALLKAIKAGPQGRIAVTYFEWAGAGIQSVVVPWTLIDGRQAATEFADSLAVQPIRRARMTSISGALREAVALLETSPFRGLRRVIDVSGDGPNNSGALVETARDETVKRGVTVNGLPIMIQSVGPWGGYFEIPELDRYYRDCVIGGTASFAIAVRSTSEFATAIRQKLLLEIAGNLPPRRQSQPYRRAVPAPVVPAQVTAPKVDPTAKYDCLVGEKRWQQFLRDGYNE